jgi:hypothetical protein
MNLFFIKGRCELSGSAVPTSQCIQNSVTQWVEMDVSTEDTLSIVTAVTEILTWILG